MRGYEMLNGVIDELRIPMRGYEMTLGDMGLTPKVVTNPHAGL